jgi:selenocysteine lyase/cysteine desulfurase
MGDEILLTEGDFPTDIYPWLPLKKNGVIIKMIQPGSGKVRLEDVSKLVTGKTKLICLSWVNSFDGHVIELDEIGHYCRQRGIIFVLNGSQAFGYKPLNLAEMEYPDVAFGCGFKWLLGPYGTGFGWMKEEFRDSLILNRYYWLNQYHESLSKLKSYEVNEPENYLDIFNTANFFNYIPWEASLRYLSEVGIGKIQDHNREIFNFIISNIDRKHYEFISRQSTAEFSSFIVLQPVGNKNAMAIQQELIKKGVFISLREGNLRITPHIYNSLAQAEYLVTTLNDLKAKSNILTN